MSRRAAYCRSLRCLSSSAGLSTEFAATLQASVQHCSRVAYDCDPENYLIARMYPSKSQASVLVLRSFQADLAGLDAVTDEHAGMIRLHWWQDTINRIYKGDLIKHDIAPALTAIVHQHALTKGFLLNMVNARQLVLNWPERQPPDINALSKYAELNYSSMLYLALESLGVKDVQADHIASHIGKSMGIVAAIRSTAYRASIQQTLIPDQVLQQYGVDKETELYSRKTDNSDQIEAVSDGLREAIFGLACVAKDHIRHARDLKGSAPLEALPCFLHAVPVDRYLDRLEEANFDVLHPALISKHGGGLEPVRLIANVIKHRIRGSY